MASCGLVVDPTGAAQRPSLILKLLRLPAYATTAPIAVPAAEDSQTGARELSPSVGVGVEASTATAVGRIDTRLSARRPSSYRRLPACDVPARHTLSAPLLPGPKAACAVTSTVCADKLC